MLQFFFSGGYMMWLLLIVAIVVVVLAMKKAIQLFGKESLNSAQLENGINAILFWGLISLVLGFFAHFQGIYMAMAEIKRANDISPAIVAGGYAASLTTILFGMGIFLVSAIIWFILRWKYKKLARNI
jgi:hypothetical protein